MLKKTLMLAVVVTGAFAMIGCNVGMAPEGNTDQALKEFEAMPPEKQLSFIQNSPMPPAEKAKRIKEIEQKYGIKAKAGGLDPSGRASY